MFAILFFFVAIGMVKPPTAKIDSTQVVLEGGTELDETSKYIQVYIGLQDDEVVAQVGFNTIVSLSDLTQALKDIREDEPMRSIVVLRIDKDTGMGYIKNEIEPAILDAGIKQVRYVLEDEEEVQS